MRSPDFGIVAGLAIHVLCFSTVHEHYEGYSIKEIAKLLGVPAPTVGTRLARGRERLRRLIKEEIS